MASTCCAASRAAPSRSSSSQRSRRRFSSSCIMSAWLRAVSPSAGCRHCSRHRSWARVAQPASCRLHRGRGGSAAACLQLGKASVGFRRRPHCPSGTHRRCSASGPSIGCCPPPGAAICASQQLWRPCCRLPQRAHCRRRRCPGGVPFKWEPGLLALRLVRLCCDARCLSWYSSAPGGPGVRRACAHPFCCSGACWGLPSPCCRSLNKAPLCCQAEGAA